MGAAMVVKPGAGQRFSVIAFGLAQVIIDIEPGVGMIRGAETLHGPSHTIIGALLVAMLVVMISPKIGYWILGRWNREVRFHKLNWLVENPTISRTAAISGAFFGTLSHIFLDAFMHDDVHPLSPFSNANPLLHLIAHDAVYQLCAVMGVIGTLAWVMLRYRLRNDAIQSEFDTEP
jgi:hypothetical protein